MVFDENKAKYGYKIYTEGDEMMGMSIHTLKLNAMMVFTDS